LSLRATEGSAAISLFSERCEIASVVSLPRNDIVAQSLEGGMWVAMGGRQEWNGQTETINKTLEVKDQVSMLI
jgi:hypothetical protein